MSSISVRINERDKSLFEDFCASVGMNVTTAFNMFVKNVISNQKLPFKIERDPFYSSDNMQRLAKAAKDAKTGRNMHYHDIIEV